MCEHDCKFKEIISLMKSDLIDIKKDIRSLLKFKWQALGAGMVIAAVTGTTLSIVFTFVR